MTKFLIALMIAMCAVIPRVHAGQEAEIVKARAAAAAWLVLLDAGAYGKSWDAASHFWKADHSREDTTRMLGELRSPLGTLNKRRVVVAQFLTVPNGECVHLEYETSFANSPNEHETVDMLREANGDWRVALWAHRSRTRD